MKRRTAIAIVAGVTIVTAIVSAGIVGPGELTPNPPVQTITVMLGSGSGFGSEDLTNSNPTGSITVQSLDNGGCADAVATPINGSTIPGTYGPSQTLHLGLQCNAQAINTMRRCRFTALDASLQPVGRFTLLCKTSSGAPLIGSGSGLNFGSVPVGVESGDGTVFVTPISAVNTLSIWVVDNDDVFKIKTPCAGPTFGGGCTDQTVAWAAGTPNPITITCKPNVAGPISTSVQMVGASGAQGSFMLGCNGMAAPASLTAMPNPVATTTMTNVVKTVDIMVTNTGSPASITFTVFPPTTPWTGAWETCATPCPLAMGQTTKFIASYLPTMAGTHVATAHFAPGTGSGLDVSLTGTATDGPMPPEIFINPVMLTSSGQVTVRNDGGSGSMLNLSSSFSGTGWTINWQNCPLGTCSLGPGSAAFIDATFAPPSAGHYTAQVVINSNDSDEPSETVFLDGLAESNITVNPPSYDVTVPVGSSSMPAEVFTVTNPGTGSGAVNLALTGATSSGTYWDVQWAGNCPGGTCVIAPGNSTTFTAQFSPLTPGDSFGSVTINSDAMNGPQMVSLTGHGMTSADGQLSVGTTSVTIMRDVDAGPQSYQLSLTNSGGGPLTIGGHAMGVEPMWTSNWSACNAGCTLNPNDTFDVDVVFDPTAIIDNVPSYLDIFSSDPDLPTTRIALTGVGQGSTIELVSSPSINFGDLPAGAPSSPSTIQIRNNGNVDTDMMILNAPNGAYDLMPSSFAIPPHTTLDITATCTPPLGDQSGDITLSASGYHVLSPNPFAIHATCRGTSSQLLVSPQPIDFGEVRTNETKHQLVTIATVADPLTIGARTLATPDARFVMGALDSMSITPGVDAHFDLAVTGGATDGDLANVLNVTAGSDTAHVSILGRVVTPNVEVTASVDLGTFCISSDPAMQTLGFKASGTATINLTAPPALDTGTGFSLVHVVPNTAGYPYAIAPGAAASVMVAPLRQNVVGEVSDRVVWASDMPMGETKYTNLHAAFISTGGAITPTEITFESVPSKQRSPMHTITIENCDAAPITLEPATIDNDAFVDVSAQPLPATLAPTQQATIDVVFEPARAGASTGVLTVSSSKGELHVALMGNAFGTSGDRLDQTGFYACGCRTADPGAGVPIIGAIAFAVGRRRRRARS